MNRSVRHTVGTALGEAWQAQLREMRACESAVSAGDNVEALHRFRVALRTTRALLRVFRDYLPASEALASELAWLSGALNRARDLDIVAQFVQNIPTPSSLNERRAFTVCQSNVNEELARERTAQQKAVQSVLHSRRYRRLVKAWENYVARCVREAELSLALQIRIETTQRVIALEQSVKLLRQLRRLEDDCAPATLHRLRIRCKRLRYLFEALPQARDDKKIIRFIKTLARLQGILGEHQDAVVIHAWFAQLAIRRKPDFEIPIAWSAAIEQQQRGALAALLPAWRAFIDACADI